MQKQKNIMAQSWTEVNDLNQARRNTGSAGAGITTAVYNFWWYSFILQFQHLT